MMSPGSGAAVTSIAAFGPIADRAGWSRAWLLRWVRRLSSGDDLGEVDILVDDPAGEIGELHVVAAGVVAQLVERGGQLQAAVLGQDAFGLLDDDAAVEGELKLLVEQFPAVDGPLLQDADRRHVRECLPEGEVWLGKRDRKSVV